MRLNYKLPILLTAILLSSASHLPSCQASPETTSSQRLPQLLAKLPAVKSSEDNDTALEDSQSSSVGQKVDSGRRLDKTKMESESTADEVNANKRRHDFDSFRTSRLDLTPLNLTTEQKDKIQSMRKESSQKSRKLRASLESKRAEMRELMFDPKATNKQILKVRDEARKLHEQADNLMVQDFLAIRELLTPEQKVHLPEIKPSWRSPMRK
jgi:Spy/CpxP family protein refolding chaperone